MALTVHPSSVHEEGPVDEKTPRIEEENALPFNRRTQKLKGSCQKLCSLSFCAIYVLCYFTLSSNPKVVFLGSNDLLDESAHAKSGSPAEHHTLRKQHIKDISERIAHVWKPIPPSEWCIDDRLKFEQPRGRPMGLCYVKMPRAASSTLAGINSRIARNFAQRQGLSSCVRHDGPTPGMYYRKREIGLSYLWTYVRDPGTRAMSRAASNVAHHRSDAAYSAALSNAKTESFVMSILENSTDVQYGVLSQGRGGFQAQYLMQRLVDEGSFWNETDPTTIQNPHQARKFVKDILDRYDFIGVVERFEESLVVMQLLMGLETSDILHFSSRLPDMYSRLKNRCYHNIDPQTLMSKPVKDYLSSPSWWAQNYADYLLHQSASKSLDMTIQAIGLEQFSRAYYKFKTMQKKAHKNCEPIFPCSAKGVDQLALSSDNCYYEDMGCGYPCLDRFGKKGKKAAELDNSTQRVHVSPSDPQKRRKSATDPNLVQE